MANKRDHLTIEQCREKLAGIESAINAKVLELNDTESKQAADKIEKDIKDLQKDYNGYAEDLFKLECIEANPSNPVFEACSRYSYRVIAVKTEHEDSGDTKHVAYVDKPINLLSFGSQYTAPWKYRVEAIAFFKTKKIGEDFAYSSDVLKSKILDFFKLSKEAAENPVASKSSLVKALPIVVSAMIGEEYGKKVIKHHTNYFDNAFTKQGKGVYQIQSASVKQTANIMLNICHAVIKDIANVDLISKGVKLPK